MPGSVGFTDGANNNVSVTTDASGNVTVTLSTNKPDGTPTTTVPPNTQLTGPVQPPNPAPAPGQNTGKFVAPVGVALYVIVESQPNCDVIISIFPNATGAGNAIWQHTYPNQDPVQKTILIGLLLQAAHDLSSKPAAAAPAPPLKIEPLPAKTDAPAALKPP
jgi:hypothetical protein